MKAPQTHTITDEFLDKFLEESNAIEGVHARSAKDDAHKAWTYLATIEVLTETDIKEAHNILLQNRQPQIAGEYRTQQVYIGNEKPPDPTAVPDLMAELLKITPTSAEEALEWHILFEQIHPFTDGNGRIGRMLYLYHCLCVEAQPRLWTPADRDEYYSLFSREIENSSAIDSSDIERTQLDNPLGN